MEKKHIMNEIKPRNNIKIITVENSPKYQKIKLDNYRCAQLVYIYIYIP